MTAQKIYRSTYPPAYCPTNLSISQYLTQYNPDAVYKDKIILEDNWTGHALTYGGFHNNTARHAWSLKEKYCLVAGDVVAISAPNSVAHVELIHAVLWSGATVALINPLSTAVDFTHYLRICRPKVIAIDTDLHQTVVRALAPTALPSRPDMMFLLGSDPLVPNYPTEFECANELPVYDLSMTDNREHTAAICFSSGTSGKPKGVELSHYNLIASLAGLRSSDPALYNAHGRCVFFPPLCHIYGFNAVGLMGIWLGSYNMLLKKYSLDELLRLSSACKANTLRIVPSIALAMLKTATLSLHDLSSIRFILCSGAVLQPEVIQGLQLRFNQAPIFQGYGLTECNVAILRSHESDRVGSVGRLVANVDARVVDDGLNDVAECQDGELLVRGPTVFRRYLGNPAATTETFHGEWMRTGDVLHFDADGFLYLTDRKKELIKYKGMQVAPSELEGILNSHAFVDESAVCATWDDNEGTEIPMAYVTLSKLATKQAKGQDSALDEIMHFVNGRVSPYKKLRGGIEVLNELPKTASGKILKRQLPARLAGLRLTKL
ncbi:acyl-CoA synthetases/AMP-acid ligases II [Paraphoma chrysanthemicola]|nr:acyl-CoA synthetases/AMP-acid ligases II [Paraphoma chrysanthemicola]